VLDEESIHRSPSIVAVAADGIFDASDLASMSVDELWNFHVELKAILTAKIAAEVRELERRIDRLNAVIDTNNRVRFLDALRFAPLFLPRDFLRSDVVERPYRDLKIKQRNPRLNLSGKGYLMSPAKLAKIYLPMLDFLEHSICW
jgi:hypothetical protein